MKTRDPLRRWAQLHLAAAAIVLAAACCGPALAGEWRQRTDGPMPLVPGAWEPSTGPYPPQRLWQPCPVPHYGFNAPQYPWGWYGVHYQPWRHLHHGVRNDRIEWTVRRGYF